MKARACAFAAITLIGALALSACDSFSLPDLFVLPGENDVDDDVDPDPAPEALALSVDRDTAERGTGTIALTPSGGTAPYSFTVTGSDLYSLTQNESLGSASDTTYIYTAGDAIGTIRITVRDSAGGSVSANVKVLPSKPSFIVAGCTRIGSGDTVNLSWSYADSAFDSYRLEFSTDGLTYSVLPGSDKTVTSYHENNVVAAATYYYLLYTIAGSWESAPDLIPIAFP